MCIIHRPRTYTFFFFNDTATTEIYTLSLHDALPIYVGGGILALVRAGRDHPHRVLGRHGALPDPRRPCRRAEDRKSTRLNSSHSQISYAVFCLKKKTMVIMSTEDVGIRYTGSTARFS